MKKDECLSDREDHREKRATPHPYAIQTDRRERDRGTERGDRHTDIIKTQTWKKTNAEVTEKPTDESEPHHAHRQSTDRRQRGKRR